VSTSRWSSAMNGLLIGALASTAGCAAPPAAQPPALVVVISVDQLKPALLETYGELFAGGFRMLLDHGVWLDAVHDHAGTSTGPGHATLATGVHPARHGIVGNSWQERRNGRWSTVEAVADTWGTIPGSPELHGRSPTNLQRGGLADWMLAADSSSRVVSIAGKDRTAILSAGQARGGVYWFEADLGRFVTSSYYQDRQSEWVVAFNDHRLPHLFRDGCWESAVPRAGAGLSRPDTVPFEFDGRLIHFPHCYEPGAHPDVNDWFSRTPFLDEATGELAELAVRELNLGRPGSVDLLLIGFSATDRVGHRWGPWSREQLDNLLRLDATLDRLFATLDDAVGPGRYVIALSADHGVSALPEHRRARGQEGERVGVRLRADLERLPPSTAVDGGLPAEVVSWLESRDYIEQVIPIAALTAEAPTDSFTRLYRNSHFPGRLTQRMADHGFDLRLAEGRTTLRRGIGHGTPYLHDRVVPLAFFGPGTERVVRPDGVARTVDLAPTLAALLGIPAPTDLDGRPLTNHTVLD
jgi:hypothetical protein